MLCIIVDIAQSTRNTRTLLVFYVSLCTEPNDGTTFDILLSAGRYLLLDMLYGWSVFGRDLLT